MSKYDINLIKYDYVPQTGLSGIEKEQVKSQNVYNILQEIRKVIVEEKPSQVNIEAIAFQANGTIDQLAGLNYGIRSICLDLNIPFKVISPTTVKAESVGFGGADKETMKKAWLMLDKSMNDTYPDDLADAYFLSFL